MQKVERGWWGRTFSPHKCASPFPCQVSSVEMWFFGLESSWLNTFFLLSITLHRWEASSQVSECCSRCKHSSRGGRQRGSPTLPSQVFMYHPCCWLQCRILSSAVHGIAEKCQVPERILPVSLLQTRAVGARGRGASVRQGWREGGIRPWQSCVSPLFPLWIFWLSS